MSGFTVRSVYRHITGALCDLWAQSAHRIITLSKNCPVEGPASEIEITKPLEVERIVPVSSPY